MKFLKVISRLFASNAHRVHILPNVVVKGASAGGASYLEIEGYVRGYGAVTFTVKMSSPQPFGRLLRYLANGANHVAIFLKDATTTSIAAFLSNHCGLMSGRDIAVSYPATLQLSQDQVWDIADQILGCTINLPGTPRIVAIHNVDDDDVHHFHIGVVEEAASSSVDLSRPTTDAVGIASFAEAVHSTLNVEWYKNMLTALETSAQRLGLYFENRSTTEHADWKDVTLSQGELETMAVDVYMARLSAIEPQTPETELQYRIDQDIADGGAPQSLVQGMLKALHKKGIFLRRATEEEHHYGYKPTLVTTNA